MSRTPEEHKNEEEPMLVEVEGNNPIVGKLTGDQKQNIAPKSALRLEQQVIELFITGEFGRRAGSALMLRIECDSWWSLVIRSIRPTISVVDTPSVRGMVR